MKVFDVADMQMKDGPQTPYLRFIAKDKIGQIQEDVISTLKRTIDLFNQYMREAESIFQEALYEDNIDKIIKLYVFTLNALMFSEFLVYINIVLPSF